MKKVFTAILATILIAMTFTACTPETKETLTFYMPDGAPALAAAQAMADEDFKLDGHEVDFTVYPAGGIEAVANDLPDIAIIPVNLASKLTMNYTIIGAVTHGNLYLLGKTAVSSVDELAGKSMSVVNLAGVPGLTLRTILNGAGVTAGTLTGAADALAAVTALEEGQVDYALVPEPAATAQMNKHNNATTDDANKWVKIDLQAMYESVFETGYPQAVIVVNKRNELTEEFVSPLIEAFDGISDWLKANTATAIAAVEANFVEGSATTMKAPAFSAAVIDGCNIEFKLASTVKANVKSYLEKIVAIAPEAAKAIPDSAFYGLA